MRIVVAPDKFKGSLTAAQAAEAIARGVLSVYPAAEVLCCPVADGGEGTARALCDALAGEWIELEVEGPLGEPVKAGYAWIASRKLAVVEMSEASGLALVAPEKRRAMEAHTYGTGQLVCNAVERGAESIVVGIGGSATTDGGAGFAAALGVQFFTADGEEIARPSPTVFHQIATISTKACRSLPKVIAATDVQNPLLGERGAARLFSPQKGASPEEVVYLEQALSHLHERVVTDFGRSLADHPGSGAAGGLGYGLMAFAGAEIRPGFDLVAEILGLEEKMRGADLVITGEGSIDLQTLEGKGPAGVASLARQHGCPAVAIGGRVLNHPGVAAAFDGTMPMVNQPMALEDAIANAGVLLEAAAARVAQLAGLSLKKE